MIIPSTVSKRSKSHNVNFMKTVDITKETVVRKFDLSQGRTRQKKEYGTTEYTKNKLPIISREKSNLVKKEPIPIKVMPQLREFVHPSNPPKLEVLPKLTTPKPILKLETTSTTKARKISLNIKPQKKDNPLTWNVKAPTNQKLQYKEIEGTKYWNTTSIISSMPAHDKSPQFQKLFTQPNRFKEEYKKDFSDYYYLKKKDSKRSKKIGPTIEELVAIRRAPERIWECISSYEEYLDKVKPNT